MRSWLYEVKGFARGGSKITCVYGEVPPGVGLCIVRLKFVKFTFVRRIAKFATTLGTQRGEFGIWAQDVVGLGGLVGFRVFLQLGWLV